MTTRSGRLAGAAGTAAAELATLTREGVSVGTPLYTAPEIWRGEVAGPASDIYSLGATYFHLLTGRPPFPGHDAAQVEQAHLGVSYRSKIKHDITGDVTFEGAPSFSLPGPLEPIGTALNARFANGAVKTTIDLPDTWSFAGAWENDKLELLADWTWTGWSSIPTLDIVRADDSDLSSVPLQFQDVWRAGLGANVKLNERFTLRLGTAYDKAPVQDQYRTPRLPDNHRVWVAGGLQWRPSQKASIDVGYTHIFVKDGPSSLPNQETATAAPVATVVEPSTLNEDSRLAGACIVTIFEDASGLLAFMDVLASVPVAFPLKPSVPAVVALYTIVYEAFPPAATVCVAGTGPDTSTAAAVPSFVSGILTAVFTASARAA